MVGEFFRYKNQDYQVLGECRLKNPETREWCKGYLYINIGGDLTFCREKVDFEQKFIPYPKEDPSCKCL